jgi:hypothetical protein
MFFARKIRVHDKLIRGGRLRVAIYGDWDFKDSELVDMIDAVVATERDFAHDFTDPYFLVTVVPTGPRVTPQNFSMGGTGLANCFALFLAPGTSIGPGSPHRNRSCGPWPTSISTLGTAGRSPTKSPSNSSTGSPKASPISTPRVSFGAPVSSTMPSGRHA